MRTSTSPSQQKCRAGFTLLEVVAAIILMSMLFAALTSLLRCFGDQRRALDQIAANSPSTHTLADLIRRDLTNAHSFRQTPNGITLLGNLANDWKTHMQSGRRAEVTYEIETIASESWLVRRETHLDELSSDRSRETPVWRGATRIEFLSESSLVTDDSQLKVVFASIDVGAFVADATPLPAHIRVMVKNGRQSLVDVAVLHHWEDS